MANQMSSAPSQAQLHKEHGEEVAFYISLAFDKGLAAFCDQQNKVEHAVGHLRQYLERLEDHLDRMEDRVMDSLSQQQGWLEQQLQPSCSIAGSGLGDPMTQVTKSSMVEVVLERLEHQSTMLEKIIQKCSSMPARTVSSGRLSDAEGAGLPEPKLVESRRPKFVSRPSFSEEIVQKMMSHKKYAVEVEVEDALQQRNRTAFDFHLQTLSKIRLQAMSAYTCLGCLTRLGYSPALSRDPHACKRFVHGKFFNGTCAGMIIAYSVFAGIEANLDIQAAFASEVAPKWTEIVTHVFNGWFALEVFLRLLVDGCEFFHSIHWRWNVFDFVLVILSMVILVVDGHSVGFFRMLRILKTLKALRIMRVFRMFTELRLLVATILTSLASLWWSIAFLLVITYLCSILFIQGGISYIRVHTTSTGSSASDPVMRALHLFFESVPQSVYFLAASITGGVDWTEVAWPLWQMNNVYGLCFTLYVLISILGILNVVTGVFVERASNISKMDRDLAISDEIARMEADVEESMQLFRELDTDNVGQVPMESFMEFLTHERVIAYFATLDIDITDRRRLRSMFDVDDDKFVSLEEFVVGCVRLRGSAKKSDHVAMMVEMQKLHDCIEVLGKSLVSLARQVNQHGEGLNSLHDLHLATSTALGIDQGDCYEE